MTEEKKYTPLLPFDSSFGEYFSTYDTVPYSCDRDYCYSMITKESGNIIKYYACHDKEPVEITTKEER